MRLDDVPRELLVAIALVATVALLAAKVGAWTRRRRVAQRFVRAAEGEREAVLLLEDRGFVVEAAQVSTRYTIDVDGGREEASVRADYVVSRGGEHFVAEVKTGRVAGKLATPATRRQLLEYQHAFGVAGVLLVDADARTVQLVTFHGPARRASHGHGIALALLAAVAAALGLAAIAR